MLILARRIGESIIVADQIEISVIDIKGDQVKLGITAPPQVKVYRREVYAAIQAENRAAASASPDALHGLEGLLGGAKGADAGPQRPGQPDRPRQPGPSSQPSRGPKKGGGSSGGPAAGGGPTGGPQAP